MIREDFIDFLTSEETLSKFTTTEKGRKFRKATPIQVAAVILCVLKNMDYYNTKTEKVLTHRLIHYILHKYKETDIELSGKNAKLTEDTIYSILRSFGFFDNNKTKYGYVIIDGRYYKDINGRRFNNWKVIEDKLCSFIGWEDGIYEKEETEDEQIEEQKTIEEVKEEVKTSLSNFVVDDNEVHHKMLEVIKNLNTATREEIIEWKDFFINVYNSEKTSKGSLKTAEAVLSEINKLRSHETEYRQIAQ